MKTLAHFWLWLRYEFNAVALDPDDFGRWCYRNRVKTDENGFIGRIPPHREDLV